MLELGEGVTIKGLLWRDGINLYPNCDHYMNLLHMIKLNREMHQKNYVYLQGSGKQGNLFLYSLFVFTVLSLAMNCLIINNMEYLLYKTFSFLKNSTEIMV